MMANLPPATLDKSGGSLSSGSHVTLDKSGGSIGSGSHRVKMKRKHLRERQSPFEGQGSQKKDTENIPPALPGTLPKDYEEIARRLSGSLSGHMSHVTRSPDLPTAAALHLDQRRQDTSGLLSSKVTDQNSKMSSYSDRPQVQMRLKQGSPNQEGFFSHDQNQVNDVRITQYAPGKRKQIMKESLSKRSEQMGPVRRVFEPRFFDGRKSKNSEFGTDVNQVAATAAAAVAATVPLIKSQHDLENKLSMILHKLDVLEAHSGQKKGSQADPTTHTDGKINEELQRRLDELTLIKLKELERLQLHENQVIQANQQDPHHHNNRQGISQPTKKVNFSSVIERNEEPLPRQVYSDPGVYRGSREHFTGTLRNSPANKLPMGHLEQSKSTRQCIEEAGHPNQVMKKVEYTPAVKVPQGATDGNRGNTVRHIHREDKRGQDEYKERIKSPLDTPAPRKHVPVPHSRSPRSRPIGGLLQEILSHEGAATPERTPNLLSQEHGHLHSHDPIITATRTDKQADHLLREIEALRKDLSGKLQDKSNPQNAAIMSSDKAFVDPSTTAKFQSHARTVTPETRKIAERELQRWQEKRLAPPPLDEYMKNNIHSATVATPSSRQYTTGRDPYHTRVISHGSQAQSSNAITQAQTLLKRVQASRMCFESNLEVIERSKKDQEFYEVMDVMYADSDSADKTKLRQLVDDYIALVDCEVKDELAQHRPHQQTGRPHSPPTKLSAEKPEKLKPSLKDQVKPTRNVKKKITSRIDTGLKKPRPDPEVGKVTKEMVTSRNKERKESKKPQDRKKVLVPSSKPLENYEDERYLSRVYGRNLFLHGQRSTLRDAPYLRIANQSPQTKRVKLSPAKDANTRASQTQTDVAAVNFESHIFSIPVQKKSALHERSPEEFYQKHFTAADRFGGETAMPLGAPRIGEHFTATDRFGGETAIPLGAPRIGGERREPLVIYNQLQQSNVAVINMVCQKPQLEIKHLPPVDIDTEVSSVSDDKVVQTLSPPLESFDSQDFPLGQNQLHQDEISESDEDEIPGSCEVVSFQGYRDHSREYNGPPFPPQAPPSQPQPRSEDIAAHLQRRDLLEHRAVEWIEQELMARMISEFHSRLSRPEQRPISPEESIPDASHTVDAIGSPTVC